jgi:phage portal protein BeeE
MLPWITRFERGLTLKLFTPAERAQGFYVHFNVEGLMRGDYKSRQEGLSFQRQNGIINGDEWRELEEMNPIGGAVGTTYLVNGNMISVETAAKQQPRQAGATPSQSGGEA